LSIEEDAEIVESLRTVLPSLPVFAHRRNGCWYAPDDRTCYFKSTDGHMGQWKFSTTRLNLEIGKVAASGKHVVIVDSTRRGKRFPDSFNATVGNKQLFKTQ
jgi:tRNA A64-2'-O-ribosylphosphate transferase